MDKLMNGRTNPFKLPSTSVVPGTTSSSVFSRVMSAGGSLSNNMWLIIGAGILFLVVAIVVYYYTNQNNYSYHANSEKIPSGASSNGKKTAELMLFFADWCPHCKAVKPTWNDLKSKYEDKTINGYTVVFTEINCSEETPEIEKQLETYNVTGFPTIKLIKDGQAIEFDAKPTAENFETFLTTVLQ